MRRHLKQILQCDVGNGNQKEIITSPSLYETNDEDYNYLIPLSQHQQRQSMYNYDRLVAPRDCDVDKCLRKALPCTIYCLKHIMNNKDQVLFNYCTAKFADNRQCSAPVFDILHELPLCPEHARKRVSFSRFFNRKNLFYNFFFVLRIITKCTKKLSQRNWGKRWKRLRWLGHRSVVKRRRR